MDQLHHRKRTAYGRLEQIVKRLTEHLDAGADHVAIQVLGGTDDETLLPALRELAGPPGLTPAGWSQALG
ncbi:hypothetical protein [Mycobacterium tilburgii]|uniref:hypothetical protein n=1 Tax=Mycobacterium tilburgii TaxID=44467 RepID=UPI003898F7B0